MNNSNLFVILLLFAISGCTFQSKEPSAEDKKNQVRFRLSASFQIQASGTNLCLKSLRLILKANILSHF